MGRLRAIGATLLLCLFSACPVRSAAGADAMPVGAETTIPIGHLEFCREAPLECRPEARFARAEPLALDTKTMIAVAALNTRVNVSVTPRADRELYGSEEHWGYPDSGFGDCEDYALMKQRSLAAMGVSLQNLLLTVVRKRDGTGHAVLTLRTAAGDFVLDNLDWRIRPWRETPYRFLKRQSAENPARWRTIEDRADVIVSSVGN